MNNRDHEKKVCRAITIILEEREGVKISDLEYPDQIEREKKAVELKFCLGSKKFALEHTQIESFTNQISDGHKIKSFLGSLEDELNGVLPKPGHYVLSIEANSVTSGSKAEKI